MDEVMVLIVMVVIVKEGDGCSGIVSLQIQYIVAI